MDNHLWGVPITKENLHEFISIDDKTGCWNWKFATVKGGYGEKTHKGKQIGVHVIVYKLFNEHPNDKTLHVLHTCDNKRCINPEHLWAGTRSENMQDCLKKGRFDLSLSTEQVKEIKASYERGSSMRALAKAYIVGSTTICRVINNEGHYSNYS